MNLSELVAGEDEKKLVDSCFVFGLHKSGSSLMHNMIKGVCMSANIASLDIPNAAFKEGLTENEWGEDESLLNVFTRKNLFYGFRVLPKILLKPDIDIRNKRFVLLVRDPRDALVSAFFSFGGKYMSHKLPEKNSEAYLEKVQKTAHLDIDDFVMNRANGFCKRMRAYHDNLNFSNGVIFRYEDIYFDKFSFLKSIFEHFEIDVDNDLLNTIAKKNDVRPTEEDVSKHIRVGSPGDHVKKLKPETIVKLNKIFAEIGLWYGYDLSE